MFLPEEFIKYTSELFGDERWRQYLSSLNDAPPVSLRYNPFKGGLTNDMIEKFGKHNPVPWCRNAYWIEKRPAFTLDPQFHAGKYYVQEAGSMFLDEILKQYVTSPVNMLDLCAAPGGKSTLARAALPSGSILFVNEPDRKRANILLENIQKQGHPDVIVTNSYPQHYAKSKIMFDVILTDVPCSGEGLFRRDHKSVSEWSVANVRKCVKLQREILKSVWRNLRPGGILIYSTCTFNLYENEENINFICKELGADVIPVKSEETHGIVNSLHPLYSNMPVYRFIPGVTRSEGLFMAVLRKHGEINAPLEISRQKLLKQTKHLNVIYDGIPKSEQRGNKLIPAHAEALSILLDKNKYPLHEVDLQEALKYLRHESLSLPSDTPRGYVLLTYNKHPVGFVNNLGNRANNLYPREWAIRMRLD